MKLAVHVLGRPVAILEPIGDFRSVLTYHANTAADDFVSLTMPVRTKPYAWDDVLHPIFQMNRGGAFRSRHALRTGATEMVTAAPPE